MIAEPFPPVADVLPHRGPMVLLSRILEHSEQHTVCAVDIRADALFVEPAGTVPAWIGLEYMAQCVAAHAGLRARARGEPVRTGFLIGSRRIDVRTSSFRVGQTLTVVATHTWGEQEAAAFACTLLDADSRTILVEGTLSVFRPRTLDGLLDGAPE